jgi:predicted TIM-barrel fold metal-dependent hydrolase
MKIDVFAHVLTPNYLSKLRLKAPPRTEFKEARQLACSDMNIRLRLMNRHPDVLQIITMALPPLETILSPTDAAELSIEANNDLAELVANYPDKFAGAVATLPMNNIEAALAETDRAIMRLQMKGVQICANHAAEPLDSPNYRRLYEKMAQYNLPIWIHPYSIKGQYEPLFGWPYETASAMMTIVSSGIFNDFPDLKFITHHAGGIVPFLESRMKWMMPLVLREGHKVKDPAEHFKKFYGDTALYGSTAGLTCAFDFFGPEHLLFGTDAPLGPGYGLTLETIDSINRMSISDADKQRVFYSNAIKLLKIPL